MTDFSQLFDRVIGHEGGYVNDPKDPGGETNWGITKRTALENGYIGAMRDLSREEAKSIYYHAFWLRYQCESMPPALAFQFFDGCINHGFGNACRMLQRAVGVLDDGIIGNRTLNAIEEMDINDILLKFNAQRLRFYTKLKNFNTYGRGWVNRIADNLAYGAKDNDEG
ncbi:glycoside hydrolase family 108 protein [[Pasteurella] aerogenes]